MKNSVVLTTYNGEKYIEEQLDSIRNQTMTPDEVLIRDDCSTDKTADTVREYIMRYNLNWDFRVNEVNKGFFDNFFDAIGVCTGDVIYLADQDDVWDLNKIEKFTELYESDPEIMMIQSNLRFIDSEGKGLPAKELYHGKKNSDKPTELSVEDMLRFAGSGYTMSFRKCVAEIIFNHSLDGQKDVFVFHDLLLGQVAAVIGKCFLISSIVDAHRLHSDNQTQQHGKSYLVGRTKEVQVRILDNRIKQLNQLFSLVKDSEKEQIIKAFQSFAIKRKEYITSRGVLRFIFLVNHRHQYASSKGIITDTMYAYGMEKMLLKLFEKV